MPEGEEWSIIDDLIKILEPFQKITEVMSKEKFLTISIAVQAIRKDIKNHIR